MVVSAISESDPLVFDRGSVVRTERIAFQFRQETVLCLLEEIHLLAECQGRLINCQSFIDNFRKELSESLVELNKSDFEYVQPGKITE